MYVKLHWDVGYSCPVNKQNICYNLIDESRNFAYVIFNI